MHDRPGFLNRGRRGGGGFQWLRRSEAQANMRKNSLTGMESSNDERCAFMQCSLQAYHGPPELFSTGIALCLQYIRS